MSIIDNPHLNLRDKLNSLIAQRTALEIEADAIHSELTSPGENGETPAGIKDKLVDNDNFPRGDIDLYRVSTLRARLGTINYDHKELMKKIDKLLVDIYSEYRPITEEEYIKNKMENKTTIFDTNISNQLSSIHFNDKPFAKIDEILEGSPAELAGLQNNDLLLSFGKVSTDINDIPNVVKEFINKPILLNVRRNNENIQCHITPTNWLGRGLLGCHIVKYTA